MTILLKSVQMKSFKQKDTGSGNAKYPTLLHWMFFSPELKGSYCRVKTIQFQPVPPSDKCQIAPGFAPYGAGQSCPTGSSQASRRPQGIHVWPPGSSLAPLLLLLWLLLQPWSLGSLPASAFDSCFGPRGWVSTAVVLESPQCGAAKGVWLVVVWPPVA